MNHIIEQVHNRNRPMPELFARKDIRNSGGWDVANVRAVRGEPFITVSGRIMRVPLDDSNLARSIRAHEQIHVKVSPQDLTPYINDVTPEMAIRSAEEARVNYIAKSLGFPMKDMITGSEKHDGEVIVQNNAWSEAVYAVASSIHTGGLRPLLTGIRREAPVWADQLREIAKEFEKFQKKQIRSIKSRHWGVNSTPDDVAFAIYGSTEAEGERSDWIRGMAFTVEFAMLIESIAEMPSPPMEEVAPPAQNEQDDNDDMDEDGDDIGDDVEDGEEEAEGNAGANGEHNGDVQDGLHKDADREELADQKQKIDRKAIQRRAKEALDAMTRRGAAGDWLDVRLAHLPLTLNVQGAIGKKRVASNVGRNPRRIQRLLTDPERRIFDKKVRASGGVVLIDCSGSMDLSKDQVKDIMLSAPGCTVIAYSCGWRAEENTYVLADKGKIFSGDLPYFHSGNGNDLRAIEYAVSRKQNISAPIVWVTDGMVYRPNGGSVYDQKECAHYAKKHRVHMEHTPEDAIEYLKGLQRGQAHKPKILDRWKELLGQS